MKTIPTYFFPMLITLPILLLMVFLAPTPANYVPTSALPTVTAQAELTTFTARAQDNRLVIYRTGRDDPILMTTIDVRTLPLADQQALQEGILLYDELEIERLLEDFGS